MYKHILFFLIAFSEFSFAQRISGEYGSKPMILSEIEILDQSEFLCVYNHLIYDPELDTYEDYYELLQIGLNYSKYGSYGKYQVDSIVKSKSDRPISFSNYMVLSRTYNVSYDYLIKDLKSSTLKVYDKVFIDYYIYEESIPQIEWELGNETEEICGHTCHNATAEFRGRTWTAWYCDIAVNNGPWKFGNLPGLILKIEDEKGEHKYAAVMLRQEKKDFGYTKREYLNTTREKFNKAILDYKNESWKYYTGDLVPKKADGSPTEISKRKSFFNPIELE